MCAVSTLSLKPLPYYSFVHRKNIVGLRVREARTKAKFTQAKLAAELQLMGIRIDRSMVAKIESGIRPVSDIEIIAIAKVLGVSIHWFFEDSDKLLKQLGNQ